MSLTEGLSKGLSLPSVSRRGFLEVNAKLAALAGAGSMAVSNAPKVFAMGTVGRPSVEAGPAGQLGEERMYYNSDTLNCMGQRCVHKIYVKDGRITRVETDTEGDPWDAWECPQMRSCVKGRGKKLEVYSPDRVKYPLERTGPRGSGQFRRVSWKYALDRMASELMRIKNSYGPQAILMHSFCNIIGEQKWPWRSPCSFSPTFLAPLRHCIQTLPAEEPWRAYLARKGHLWGRYGRFPRDCRELQPCDYPGFRSGGYSDDNQHHVPASEDEEATRPKGGEGCRYRPKT